tara:strand:- start:831 stop:1910 length:1080 start_codon:yes stop_codon:yes gene_type:complete
MITKKQNHRVSYAKGIGKLLLNAAVCIVAWATPYSDAADKLALPDEKGIELSRETKLRIVSYNGFWTTIFPKDNGELRNTQPIAKQSVNVAERVRQFASWGKQAHADIFAMQEIIYHEKDMKDTTAEGIRDYFKKVTGQDWHAAGDKQGRLVLSRHPIIWSGRVRNARGMAALIDLPDTISQKNLLLINLHFLSSNGEIRVKQSANAVKFIKAVRAGSHESIPKDTPVVVCGDFNSIVTDTPHNILLKLDAEATEEDNKKTYFVNPKPTQLRSEFKGSFGSVTWTGEIGNSEYTVPEKTIDHILIPKGFMEIRKAFVLNSLILPKSDLDRYDIEREALLLVRQGLEEKLDHLPVFVDLK